MSLSQPSRTIVVEPVQASTTASNALRPSSSRMYEPLLRRMAATNHLIAPDFIGFGHSDAPDPKSFAYTFDHLPEALLP